MDPSLARALSIVEGALALEEAERVAFVHAECGGDGALEAEVLELLSADDDSTFLRPPLEGAPPTDLADRFLGRALGDFTIDRVIAGGGMGTVFEATQAHPRRTVALKILRPTLTSPSTVHRFREEAEILGRLDHPAIAKIHDAGVAREAGLDVPWFAMELVEGARDVVTYASDTELDVVARITLFGEILDAVRHGHQKGVIHRDLKPSNLLVDRDGRPKVIDFGVARAVDAEHDSLRTATGEIVGTLRYMSPEQFEAEVGDVDTRTDVFSLGVVLYELLVGRPPFDLEGKGVLEIARTVRAGRMVPPRDAAPTLPEDLDWILRRALDPDRSQRYEGAGAMAEDLVRWRRSEPVHAGPPTARYRARKFVRRHRLAISVATVILVLFVGGFLGTLLNWREAVRRTAQAEEESRQANEAVDFLAEMLQTADPYLEEPDLRVSDLLDRAAALVGERFDGAPEREIELRRVLAETYTSLGRWAPAEGQLALAREIKASLGGPPDHVSIDLARKHAKTLSSLRRYDEGRALLDEALHHAELLSGPSDELTAVVRMDLAAHLMKIGHAVEGLREIESVLPVAGPHHQMRARRLHASLLTDLGREIEALEVMNDLIHSIRARDDVTPIDLASLLTRRSLILRSLSRFDEASDVLRESLAIVESELGPDHVRTLRARGALAEFLLQRRNYEEAEGLIRRSLTTLREVHGRGGADTADERDSLARIFIETGRLAEGRQLLEESLADRIAAEGTDHFKVTNARAWLGGCIAATGDIDESARRLETLIDEMCASWNPVYGATVEFIQFTVDRYYTDARRAEEILRFLLEAVKGRAGIGPESEAWIAISLVNAVRNQAHLAEAEAIAEESLARLRSGGVGSEAAITTLLLIQAGIRSLRGDFANAQASYREILEHPDLREDASRVAGTRRLLAESLLDVGRKEEAEQQLILAAEVDLGAESPDGALILHRLGQLARDRGDEEEAARRFRAAAEMTTRSDAQACGAATAEWAVALLASGKVEEAKALLEEVEQRPGRQWRRSIGILQRLYEVLGDDEGMARLQRRLDPPD